MSRNYDARESQVFVRVPQVEIRYDKNNVPDITYVELFAIVDGDNKLQHLDGVGVQVRLDINKITEPVQCVDPITGEPIPGMSVTKEQLVLGLLAFIRADQKRRDLQNNG